MGKLSLDDLYDYVLKRKVDARDKYGFVYLNATDLKDCIMEEYHKMLDLYSTDIEEAINIAYKLKLINVNVEIYSKKMLIDNYYLTMSELIDTLNLPIDYIEIERVLINGAFITENVDLLKEALLSTDIENDEFLTILDKIPNVKEKTINFFNNLKLDTDEAVIYKFNIANLIIYVNDDETTIYLCNTYECVLAEILLNYDKFSQTIKDYLLNYDYDSIENMDLRIYTYAKAAMYILNKELTIKAFETYIKYKPKEFMKAFILLCYRANSKLILEEARKYSLTRGLIDIEDIDISTINDDDFIFLGNLLFESSKYDQFKYPREIDVESLEIYIEKEVVSVAAENYRSAMNFDNKLKNAQNIYLEKVTKRLLQIFKEQEELIAEMNVDENNQKQVDLAYNKAYEIHDVFYGYLNAVRDDGSLYNSLEKGCTNKYIKDMMNDVYGSYVVTNMFSSFI